MRAKIFNLLNSGDYKSKYTPEHKKELQEQYRDSIGLGTNLSFSADALDKYAEGKKTGYKDFFQKDEQGKEISSTFKQRMDALPNDNNDKAHIADVIKSALKPQGLFIEAKNNYAVSIKAFKELVKKVPETHDAASIRAALDRHQGIGRQAIQLQHKKELEHLDRDLKIADIKKAFDADDEEAEKLKTGFINDLKASQKTQLDQFNKSAAESLTKIDEASSTEMERLLFTAQLKEFALNQTNDQSRREMLLHLEELRVANRKARGLTEPQQYTEAIIDVEKNTITAINPDDLKFVMSLSGNKITHDAEKKTWSVQLTHRFWSPLYYASNKDNPKVDMLLIAAAVRASGFDKITMKVSFTDEKTFKMRARQAYESCLDTGFDPKKIEIQDASGKIIKPEELFGPQELSQLHTAAQKTSADLDALKSNKSKKPLTDLKQELADLKQAAAKPGETVLTAAQEKQMEEQIKTELRSGPQV
jgi:hypothetical protein